jgi:hypothetical protein
MGVGNYATSTAGAVAPAPVKSLGALLGGALAAGVGFSILYLLLSKPGAPEGVVSLATGAFEKLASPVEPIFGATAKKPAATTAVNSYLNAPVSTPATAKPAVSSAFSSPFAAI